MTRASIISARMGTPSRPAQKPSTDRVRRCSRPREEIPLHIPLGLLARLHVRALLAPIA